MGWAAPMFRMVVPFWTNIQRPLGPRTQCVAGALGVDATLLAFNVGFTLTLTVRFGFGAVPVVVEVVAKDEGVVVAVVGFVVVVVVVVGLDAGVGGAGVVTTGVATNTGVATTTGVVTTGVGATTGVVTTTTGVVTTGVATTTGVVTTGVGAGPVGNFVQVPPLFVGGGAMIWTEPLITAWVVLGPVTTIVAFSMALIGALKELLPTTSNPPLTLGTTLPAETWPSPQSIEAVKSEAFEFNRFEVNEAIAPVNT